MLGQLVYLVTNGKDSQDVREIKTQTSKIRDVVTGKELTSCVLALLRTTHFNSAPRESTPGNL